MEKENFFLYSPSADFLGAHQYRRDENSFTLVHGTVERVFPAEEYCLVVNKNAQPVGSVEAIHFYIREGMRKLGITETSEGNDVSMPWYKLIRYQNFLQAYSSLDGKNWENLGGWDVNTQTVQGFAIEKQPGSSLELEILDYKYYRSPYLTIGGLYANEYVEAVDDSTVIDRKTATSEGVVDLFLPYTFTGVVSIYTDTTKTTLLHSEEVECVMGDEFLLAEHDIAFFYKGRELTWTPTLLHERTSTIIARNEGSAIDDLLLSIDYDGPHTVLLSVDGTDYTPTVTYQPLPSGDTDFFVKMIRNPNVPITARLLDFGLVVERRD